ncbi:unnamed protein product [Adineta ricciae]|uniref:G-protein coupled receptors family 1 profile domain-containing protein n=1 Tax=Adineta ricciae TaxID=249248 RepID=A0A815S6B4_ADIRI|nr:unnamed protein product [Adineta ricciae]CAF1487674.1 unnamed protein product [Adineta ricciae]
MSSLTTIQIVQGQLVRYMPLFTTIIGTIGNILNCIIFSRRSLRRNSCSIYFFASSIGNFFAIYFGCVTRILGSYSINPPLTQMALYCKTKTFLTYIGLAGSAWFIVGACADRYASSASTVRIRSFSQVKNARRAVVLIAILVILIYFQMNFCFDGNVQSANCYPATPFCNTWNDFNLLVTFSLFPPILMLILGWMTIRNVRVGQHLRRESNFKDRQLTAMLFIQVICTGILTLPISVQKIYSEMTLHQSKTVVAQQIESFFATFVVLLALLNTSTSFYLFTLTGKVFRKELKQLFCTKLRQTAVEPTATLMKMTNRKSAFQIE